MRTPTRYASALGWVESINSWKRGRADAAGAIAAPTASQSWSNLDSRGNWVAWNDGTGNQTRVHSGANEIQSIQVGSATTSFQWDGAGNRLADGTSAFAWNIRGLMDTVKRDGAVLGTYGYDALGRRNLKVAGGRRTVFVYDGWQCVWQKVTGSGTDTTKAFVYANYIDEPVNMVRKWGSSTDTLWYMQGNNFNVEALTDRTGAIVERYEYTPYGKVTIFTGAGPDGKWLTADDVVSSTSARGNSLTFQGRELDAETGLYYFRNRYYSTWLGRFMSRDPLRYRAGDLNMMRFESNSPAINLDPSGLVVYRCKQLAEDYRLRPLFINHHWLKTDKLESGMYPDGNGGYETVDHTERGNQSGVTCDQVRGVDEECVNKEIALHTKTASWSVCPGKFFTCQNFVDDVLKKCRIKPKRPSGSCPADNTSVDNGPEMSNLDWLR